MKIYTRTGDGGQTHRLQGGRVPKDHPQIEACGAVDELNAALGWAQTLSLAPSHAEIVRRVQNELFALGAMLAGGESLLDARAVERLEREIDSLETGLPPLTQFILPGGSSQSAAIHIARTACRRAERRVAPLLDDGASAKFTLAYLNRLADLLFVLARAACHHSGAAEVTWSPDSAGAAPPPETGREGPAERQ